MVLAVGMGEIKIRGEWVRPAQAGKGWKLD